MGVQERMISHIWKCVADNDQNLIDAINIYRNSQGKENIIVEMPNLPFPRIPYCDAIKIVKARGGEIEWGDDIESRNELMSSGEIIYKMFME